MPLPLTFTDRLLNRLNLAPAPALDMFSNFAFRFLLAAIRLNVFDTLEQQAMTSVQLAQYLRLDPRGTAILLECLVSLGYIRRRGEKYSNTPMTKRWLTGEENNISPLLEAMGIVIDNFLPLTEQALTNGTPPVPFYEYLEQHPDLASIFQKGMAASSTIAAKDLADIITVPRNSRLLDVGGGHGRYSIELCQRHSTLTATIVDLEQSLDCSRSAIRNLNLEHRIHTFPANFLVDELPKHFDIALLLNVLHVNKPEDNEMLLRKMADVLRPGGTIYIVEQNTASSPIAAATSHLLSLAFFETTGGQVYPVDTISRWLTDAGFSHVNYPGKFRVLPMLMNVVSGTLPSHITSKFL